MLTLPESMRLGGQNCLAALAAEDEFLPIWSVIIRPDRSAICGKGCVQHNICRWWDAVLRLEAATGFEIPEFLESAMKKHLRVCFENKLDLVCEHPAFDAKHPHFIDIHTQREGFLALAMLIRYRNDDWARKMGRKMVRSLNRFLRDDGLLDYDLFYEVGAKPGEEKISPDWFTTDSARMVVSTGRMIEGLTELYLASGDDAALCLACRLAAWHLERSTSGDGNAPDVPFPKLHTHSYLNTLRGILRVGLLTGRREYTERIAETFRVAVRGGITESGFVSHDWRNTIKGDSASTGDAAQIAVELGVQGYTEFFDDAEKYIRARIFPGQITGDLGLTAYSESTVSAPVLEEQSLGGYAGIHRYHPNAWQIPTTDVTTSNVHGLCAVYTRIFTPSDHGLFVNLHFDCEHGPGRIRQERDAGRRSVTVSPAEPGRVFIRIPRWVPSDSVTLSSGEKKLSIERVGDYALVRPGDWDSEVTMAYDLPDRTSTETVGKSIYEFRWLGDEIESVSPNTDFLPFYPTTPGGMETGVDAIELDVTPVMMPE